MHNEAGLVDCAGHRGLSALPSRCYFGLSRALHTYLLQSLQIVACAYQVHTTATGGWCWYHDNTKKSVTGIVHTSRIVLPRTITKKITGRKSEISRLIPKLERCSSILCILISISKHIGAYNWTTGTPFRYNIKLFTYAPPHAYS